jgi:hypothetical protein
MHKEWDNNFVSSGEDEDGENDNQNSGYAA